MFIQTEQTPNPATLKFLPGRTVMDQGVADFTNPEEVSRSPLAEKLFSVDGVCGVLLGHDFVTVTKGEQEEWYSLKPVVLGAMMEFFMSGDEVIRGAEGELEENFSSEDTEIVNQIKELLDSRVRPAVAQDGGDIVFHGFDKGIVYLHMRGACAGCPSSVVTLKNGIENLLKYFVPEVAEVRSI